jgi:1-acyl-sn-glycerol-3-phosphate acyltransferase
VSRVKTGFVGMDRGSILLYRVVRFLVCGATRLYTRMSIDGRDRLPETGGYVFAPVHRSYIDTPISGYVSKRRMRFMGKDSMWKYERLGKLFSLLGAFPVSRGTTDREALKRCIDVLKNGEPLVLYPEGERKDGPVVQPLYDGATFVAAKAGVPIIPVGIGGSAKVMPRNAKFVYPHKVHVIVGEPIVVETNEQGRATREMLTTASTRLHAELQRLFDEAQAVAG